jgi:hypothetical protein
MARLEGFHICTAYRMTKEHIPRWGPHCQWVYLSSNKVLEECKIHTIQHYIDVWWQTIARYIVGHSIFAKCREADQRHGLVPRQRWWEQRMCLNNV